MFVERAGTPISDSAAFFPDGPVGSAAADARIDPDGLRALLGRHQEGMQDLPGVDGFVYEWRTSLRDDPLVFADGEAYYVALPRRIRREFADHHDVSEAEFEAMLAAHAATASAAVSARGGAADGPASLDDGEPMVLITP